ncbi:MAG: hypothetical protein LUG24_07600 [Clostridiales bacterium]|nr:hypothetical protein [Clostridiales bacterium]
MLEKCLSKKLLSEKEAVEIHMELLDTMGNLYSTDGDLPKARKAYNKAIQIGNDKFGKNNSLIRFCIYKQQLSYNKKRLQLGCAYNYVYCYT